MAGSADDIGKIRDFETLLRYLQKNLDWPIDLAEIDELTFEYQPEELGLGEDCQVKIHEVKHLRPFTTNQPWGIFWIEFENQRLPVVVMRRILRALVPRKRASARPADRAVWNCKDLLFISSLGEHGHRRITFSHFREERDSEPTLETFSWDERETHFYYLERLHMDRLQWPSSISDVEGWRRQWASAFTSGYREPIRTAKELSEKLAALAARTRDLTLDVLRYERSDGPLHRLLDSFQKVLLHDLKEDGFADMVAQTVAYGLFSARCTGQEVLGLAHLEAMVPNTNRFLKELFAELAGINGRRKGQINFDDLGLSEMVHLLRNTNIEAVLEDFGRQTGGGKEDPVVHFYETFLNVYDKHQKVQRGVFYTPKPVVSFIVRSVHEILQKEFGLPDGLADTTCWGEMADRNPGLNIPPGVKSEAPFVQILDPAAGTGTFLEEVIDVVHRTMTSKWRSQGESATKIRDSWNEYVPKHLLPRIHGFELMMAPYSVAHMKLGLKLRQTEYDFKSNQQLRVYLTNTLEPPEKGTRKLGFLPDFLSHESMQADLVKEKKPITVVIGNPPYSGHSVNNQIPWIVDKVYDYKRGIPELQKPAQAKWLQDDYVKFLRYAHFRVELAALGVAGFITNHSYIDNPTFLGMRKAFLHTFSSFYVLDLHGNAKKKEAAPDGGKDENVFDIQQGVAVSLLVKAPRQSAHYWHKDLFGVRETKYGSLMSLSTAPDSWCAFEPSPPRYLFLPTANDLDEEYAAGYLLPEIFNQNGDPAPGIVTTHDEFAISWSKQESISKVEQLLATTSETEAREVFQLCTQSQWNYLRAKKELRGSNWVEQATPILYRPFDIRWTIYNPNVAVHRRDRVMRHMLRRGNIGIITSRQTKDAWAALATNIICGHKSCAGYDINYLFPLLLFVEQLDGRTSTVLNLNPQFVELIEKRLGIELVEDGCGDGNVGFESWDVMNYIYAIFYSPSYRARYEQYLKRDFARIPVTADRALFWRLVVHGKRLTSLHVFETDPAEPATFCGSGASVDVVEYEPKAERVYVSSACWFGRVPEGAWQFRLGGYQVCQKWLKDRRGRRLSKREVEQYERTVGVLKETIDLMDAIDREIARSGGWPVVS